MAHFAQLDENNIVVQVIVVSNDVEGQELPFPQSEAAGIAFCQSLFGADTKWAQTSYNAKFRNIFAGIGFKFQEDANGVFIPPQPYPSWTLNTSNYQWEPPIPYPNDGSKYKWDEEMQSWDLIKPLIYISE